MKLQFSKNLLRFSVKLVFSLKNFTSQQYRIFDSQFAELLIISAANTNFMQNEYEYLYTIICTENLTMFYFDI